MTEVARFKVPEGRGKLTGTTIAKVTAYKATVSKMDQTPQIEFEFTTRKNTKFLLWLTVSSPRQFNTFLQAGILRRIGAEEAEVVPLGLQPELRVTLKDGKLVAFFPLDESES